jgi:integrase
MLTKVEVETIKVPGKYLDGNGLSLVVDEGKKDVRKSWEYRYTLSGRTRYMGLGSYPDVSLAAARKKADEARKLKAQGIDPITQRDTELAKTQTAQKTFKDAAEAYYADKHMAWSKGNQKVWRLIHARHIFPVIGDMRISDVGKNDVLRVLKNTAHYPDGFYATKTPTAKRCQGAMKAVLDYAAWHNWRDEKTLNPATWKGHLDKALPGPQAVNPTENHPALPWQRIGEFVQDLRRTQAVPVHGNNLRAVAASCLEFQILTAARPGEALNAQWSHIRMDERLWVIPAHGMKERRKHQVPLSDQAIALLEKAAARRKNDWVFVGRGLAVMSHEAPWRLLQHMGYVDADGVPITLHGFRSTFSEWGNTATNYNWQLIEMSLAHEIKGNIRGRYFRGDLLEQRRPLMQDGPICSEPWQPAEIIHLHQRTGNE